MKDEGGSGKREGRKGADKGMDGVINFFDDASGKPKRAIVQVKSGKVKSGDIRDLVGVVEREQAAIGVFITLETPSRDMKEEAAAAGVYQPKGMGEGFGADFPKIQILTITDLLSGSEVKMPRVLVTFKEAPKVKPEKPRAQELPGIEY